MILAFLLTLVAQDIAIPPPPRGFGTSAAEIVVDAASVLSPGAEDRINRIAFEVHARTGGEMAFVTMPDLRGRDVAEVALRIGREWGVGAAAGIGDRARNAGIVVLVVPRETNSEGRGRIRIETGRGVEGFITDAIAGDIQREAIPYFERGDYDGAMVLIAERIAERFAREFGVSFVTSVVPPRPLEPGPRPNVSFSPGSITITSGWTPRSIRRHEAHFPHASRSKSAVERGSRQLIARAIAIATRRFPTPGGPASRSAGGSVSCAMARDSNASRRRCPNTALNMNAN